jgi:hypothetical protein
MSRSTQSRQQKSNLSRNPVSFMMFSIYFPPPQFPSYDMMEIRKRLDSEKYDFVGVVNEVRVASWVANIFVTLSL